VDRYVRTDAELAETARAFRRESLVAVDTEAASFHKYVDRVYLMQLSTREHTALVDPLAVADLAPVGALLADSAIEKVFHDADYDLRILDRDYSFRAVRLFDTRISAQLLGEPAIGLASLLEKYVGVKLSKAHQKADWSQRPLPPAMIAYAADDTRHLPRLRDALHAALVERGRLTWAEEEFQRLESLRWSGPAPDGGSGGEAWLRVKGVKALPPRQLAAFRELHTWRERLAEHEDKAPFRIIGNDALLAVSRALPTAAPELTGIPDLPGSLARRHGSALLDAVGRARALAESDLPKLERPPRYAKDPQFDVRVERMKAARNRIAAELGLDPGVLCGRSTLEAVARAVPPPKDRAGLAQVGELRRWQIEVLGDALLEALR
jgi:ribonuclease D